MLQFDVVLVRAECELPLRESSYVIQRLEIPHGYFERRIDLPDLRLELQPPQSVDGLLRLTLRKARSRA